MNTHEEKDLLIGYIDGELSPQEIVRFETHLSECEECKEDLKGFKELDEIISPVEFITPEDKLMDNYWSNPYRKIERKIGIISLLLGFSVLIGFGLLKFGTQLWFESNIPIFLKFSIYSVIAGAIILVISLLREKLFLRKKQRYSEVRR